MNIGFFGGSFDPIHFGHLFLALQIAEARGLDRVLVCPAFCSPFKTAVQPVAAPHHRLEMLKRVIAEIPHFEVSSIEIDRGGPSYTIDTIRSLPPASYRLILSEEAAADLHRWKEAEELIRLAPPLVGCRSGAHFKGGLELVVTRNMDISSTEIRERLKKQLYCGHLVPAAALDYIREHRLYQK